MLDAALYVLAAALVVIGLIGAVLPNLPGIPMIFGGIWLAAAVDNYRHLGTTWLIVLGLIAAFGIAMDFIAASLGAKRVGASSLAVWGASIGTIVGLFFGLPGLILGPFVGALAGELFSSGSVLRSAHVGMGTWLGLLFGALVKLVLSLIMVAMAAGVWLLHL
ncbi:membrane protein [Dyella flava]|nr:membrane protein [Dyella flava]